jgi:hypothetical protein
MLIDALHAALKYAVKALNCVCVGVATDIFASAVAGKTMGGEMLIDPALLARFVRHDDGFGVNVGFHDRHNVRRAGAVNMERAATFTMLH